MGLLRVVALSVVGVLTGLGGAVALSSGTGPNCATGTIDTATITASNLSIEGFAGDQLVNAGVIMNAATSLGLPIQAQTIGVMTAIGESSLRNLTYGDNIHGVTNPDGTPTSSLGLFQQQQWWGSETDRLNPARAAAGFFAALKKIDGWETQPPSAAAHTVQNNADPDHYTRFFAPAAKIVAELTAIAGSNCLGSDPVALAQELVAHANNGTLTGLVPDHIKEIRWIAQGRTVTDCGIDERILQIIVIAVRNFDRVGISDINRACTGQNFGTGWSSHTTNGGGMAVDFYSLDGRPITGADGLSIRLIGLLDPVIPDGARVGQSECRSGAGIRLALDHLDQFPDRCNHLHIDVALAGNAPMLITQN